MSIESDLELEHLLFVERKCRFCGKIKNLLEDFYLTRNLLEEKISKPISAELIWKPLNKIDINEDQAIKILKLIEVLDESDDVQTISSNFDVSDQILERLSS